VVVEAVSRTGAAVLNAEDPLVAEMAAACDGRVIYFSRTPDSPIMAAHLAEGGSGVFVVDDVIVLATGQQQIELVELARVPFTIRGKIDFQVMNALAATAAAWAAGLNPAMIGRALTTFQTDAATVPGRFNHFELGGVEIIVDYGHNRAALEALGQAIQALTPRHTVMALTLPGDRRDEDLIASAMATLPYVDAYVLFDAADRRDRAVNEVPELIRRHLPADLPCEIARVESEAVAQAWRQVRPGDRLLLICDEAESGLAALHLLAASVNDDLACVHPLAATPEEDRRPRPGSFPALTGLPIPPGQAARRQQHKELYDDQTG
jgi:cyanophycin synthetase